MCCRWSSVASNCTLTWYIAITHNDNDVITEWWRHTVSCSDVTDVAVVPHWRRRLTRRTVQPPSVSSSASSSSSSSSLSSTAASAAAWWAWQVESVYCGGCRLRFTSALQHSATTTTSATASSSSSSSSSRAASHDDASDARLATVVTWQHADVMFLNSRQVISSCSLTSSCFFRSVRATIVNIYYWANESTAQCRDRSCCHDIVCFPDNELGSVSVCTVSPVCGPLHGEKYCAL